LSWLFAALCLAGCAAYPSFGSPARVIGSEEAATLWKSGQAKLIDTRHPEERAGGVIPQAAAIPFGAFPWSADVHKDDNEAFVQAVLATGAASNDVILMVCSVGVRARAAAELLHSRGFLNVRAVAGGYLGNKSDPGWQFVQ
jgi:rhodanese-related sulfurtransferase